MCVVPLKSMTLAIKTKKTLNEYGIRSEIIKLEPNMTPKGCAYGVEFECLNLYLVKDVLNNNRIKYSEIISI